MKNKKILFLVSSMQGGGSQRVASLLCNFWEETNNKVTLMPTYSGRGNIVYNINSGVKIIFLADLVSAKKNSFVDKVNRFLSLRRYIKKNKPEVIVSFLTSVNILTILASYGTSAKVIVSERSFPPLEPSVFFINLIRKYTYPLASTVVMQTNTALAWLKKESPKSHGVIINNPITYPLKVIEPIIHPDSIIDSSRKIIIWVARLDADKRPALAVDAFCSIANFNNEWDLVLLGDAETNKDYNFLSELSPEAIKLISESRILMPGRVGNLDHWYKRSSLFILTSDYEGFPNSLLEAMSYGVAPIAVDNKTGLSEIINTGKNGILVEGTQGSRGLAEQIQVLINNPLQRHEIAKNASQARDKYSIKKISQSWTQLL